MDKWQVDGYQATLLLDEPTLEEGETALDDAAARYFGLGLTDERDKRLTFYYEGREFPSYGIGGKEAKLSWSKALTSRFLGVFPDFKDYFQNPDAAYAERPKLLFDKRSDDEYAVRIELPWNPGVHKKQDFFEYLGTGRNPGKLRDAYDIVFIRELFDNLDNRGFADVFMVSGKLKKRLEKRLNARGVVDEAAQKQIENLKEAGLDDVLSFLMENQYQPLADRDYILMQQLDEHFLFRLDPELYSELSTDDQRFIVKSMDDKLEAYYQRQDAPSLTESLESFMFDYSSFYNKDFRYSYKDIITDAIPGGLLNLGLIDLSRYQVEGFPGKDDWAEVPYIAIRDIKNARLRDSGLYLAYILNKDTQTLYLALLIGYQPILDELRPQELGEEELGLALEKILTQTVSSYRHQLDTGSFNTDSEEIELPDSKYENAVIAYKTYDRRAPLEETIREDLAELLDIYPEALSIDPADYQPTVVEVVAPEEEIEEEVVEDAEESVEETESEETESLEEIESLEETEIEEPVESEEVLEEPVEEVVPKPDLLERPRQRRVKPVPRHINHPDSIISKEAIENVRGILTGGAQRRINPDEIELRPQLVDYVEPEDTTEVMQSLEKDIRARGYSPTSNLISDLYLSLKTYPLVTLTGSRGSDIDKFVRLYCQALGATFENGRFLQTRVKNTRDTVDKMFGYYNPYTSLFREGVLTDFILHAVEEPDAPFFIYLKDLPLNTQEDFLGELLSIFDTRRRHGDEIITDPILRYEHFGQDEEAMSRYNRLYLPNNLFIIAGLHRDEYDESELALLNHAGVINVGVDTLKLAEAGIPEEPTYYGSQFLYGDLLELSESEEEKEMIHDVIVLLEAINGILTRINAQIGPRERDEICLFLLYNAQEGLLSQDEALDLAILQKILPRIYGSGVLVESVLSDLFKICAGTRSSEAIKNYQNEGGLFPKSARKLSQMAKDLDHGKTASIFS